MKTSAIANLPATSGASSAAKPDAPSETSFGQVLSREVENRSNVNESNMSRANEGRPNAQDPQTASPAANANKTSSAKEENAAPDTTDTPVAAKGDEAGGADGVLPEDEETAVDAVSAEFLALVANLNPVATGSNARSGQLAETAQSGVTADLDGSMATAGVTDAANITNVTDTSLAAASATDSAIAAEESHAQPGDFDAALMRAQNGKSASQEGLAKADTPREGLVAAAQSTLEARTSQAAQDGLSSAASAANRDAMSSAQMQQVQTAVGDTANRPASPGDNPGWNQALSQAQDIPASMAPANIGAMSQAQQIQGAANEAANHLAPRVGTPGWDQSLGQKVVWMASNAQQSASLILNPPDLGPLQVVLNVSNNEATAQFTAAQPEVRQALEASMPKLREMLGEAGIQLGEASVSAGTPGNQQNTHSQQARPSHEIDQTNDDIANASVQITSSKVMTGRQGMVDTFA